jgi:hypothetical protein
MGKWIKLILDLLLSVFRWRANVTDPKAQEDADYRKKYSEWEQELRRLEDAETKAGDKWRKAITGLAYSGNIDQLRTEYLQASLAVGRYRARQPQYSVPGP